MILYIRYKVISNHPISKNKLVHQILPVSHLVVSLRLLKRPPCLDKNSLKVESLLSHGFSTGIWEEYLTRISLENTLLCPIHI